jgi:hypothetical protein
VIDYLWVAAALILTVGLTIRLIIDTRRHHAELRARNAQKTFHMTMQLPDRLKMDLHR